jgi:hypothetical protein
MNVLWKCKISGHFSRIFRIFAKLCDVIFFAQHCIKITRKMIYAPFLFSWNGFWPLDSFRDPGKNDDTDFNEAELSVS